MSVPPLLAPIQALVNTRAMFRGEPFTREDLDSPAALEAWWRREGVSVGDAAATAADLGAALVVREGLRGLLAHNNASAQPGDEQAIARLHDLAATLPLRVEFSVEGRPELAPVHSGSTRAALADLLGRVVRAQADGSWSRLKACHDPHCREAFYDTSRNRSRTWCSMELCGSRAKQRTFAQRRRARERG